MGYKVRRDQVRAGTQRGDRHKESPRRWLAEGSTCQTQSLNSLGCQSTELIHDAMGPDGRKFSLREPSQAGGPHTVEVLETELEAHYLYIPRSIGGTTR